MQKVFLYLLWVSFGIQLFYFLYFYFRIIFISNKKQINIPTKPVSVIISAKNEANNLKKFLPKILSQKYTEFEIIVINDASEDNTLEVLNKFAINNSNLKIVNIKKSIGKKNALTKGIETSKNNYLLITDADCYPVSENWISEIMQTFEDKTEVVLAYGAYEQQKGFLNKLICFDTLFIAIKYISYALAGIPYMGVGRNLAYKKDVFIKNKGFNSHKHILSGDDDLFVQEVANKKNTSVVISKESYTKSIPKKTWKEFFTQKRRHLTTGVKYKLIHKILFATDEISKLVFYTSLLLLLYFKMFNLSIVILYFTRVILLIITSCLMPNSFKGRINLFFIPIFDVLIPIITLTALVSNFFNKRITWK